MYYKLDNANLYYEIHGEGYPVVFLSGFGGGLSLWKPIIHGLKKKFTVILYDHRGTGNSKTTEADKFSMHLFASDLKSLLQYLDIPEAIIVGYSMGGWIAQNFAVEYPQMVKALALVNTTYKIFEKQKWIIKYYQQKLMDNNIRELAEVLLLSYYSDVYFEDQELLLDRLIFQSTLAFQQQPNQVWIDILDACLAHNIENQLNKLKMPIQIISGEHDFLCSRHIVKKYFDKILHAQHTEFKEVGHAVPMERKKELKKVLGEFLTGY